MPSLCCFPNTGYVRSQEVPLFRPSFPFLLLALSSVLTAQEGQGGFLKRLGSAYWDDWHPKPSNEPAPKFRGFHAPEANPPFPFTVWPIGGTVNIGQPFTISTSLMTALYGGEGGGAWKRSRITM